jgi:hypothetical protein
VTVIRGPRAATEDEQRAIDKHRAELQRQEQKRRKRNNQVAVLTMLLRPLVDLLRLVDHLIRKPGRGRASGTTGLA